MQTSGFLLGLIVTLVEGRAFRRASLDAVGRPAPSAQHVFPATVSGNMYSASVNMEGP